MFAESGLAGRPGLRYLEIGAFEGASLCWMLDNVLTDPSSRATVIDLSDDRPLFRRNLALSGAADRVEVLVGWSRMLLRDLPRGAYDVVYIDGGHHSADVFLDLALSWDLLKPEGLLILDDYAWGSTLNERWPADACPKPTIDLFLIAFANQVDILRKDYQVAVRKRERHPAFNFVRLGPFEFHWYGGSLVDTRTGIPVELTGEEVTVLTRYCRNLALCSQPAIPDNPAHPVLRDPTFRSLVTKLGIGPWVTP